VPAGGPRRQAIGIALVLFSAVAFAVGPSAARLALDNGSNPITVAALRSAISVALMGLLLVALRGGLRPDRRAWRWCLLAGALQAVTVYAFIGALALVPVGVAVLVFFTHPILIAVIAHLRGRERLTRRKAVLAVLAFAGLAAVLAPGTGALPPAGLALAGLAALAITGMILCAGRAQEHASSTQVNLIASTASALGFALVATLGGGWQLPANATGWIGILGAGFGIGIALLAFFAALRHLSVVRATMLSSIEPLLSILFAALVLGERLQPWQWAGATVAILALALFETGREDRTQG
jgi:drug/metabolite transporter (DMT)-like permease